MTLRTTSHYVCSKGHKGVKERIENDQPYSRGWEDVTLTGMSEDGKDERGWAIFKCQVCGQRMVAAGQS